MNHVFLFLYFDIWGISDCGDTIPPRVSKFLEIVNNSPGVSFSKYRPV